MVLKIITYLILFVFPASANLVEHAGSASMTTLVILGVLAWITRNTAPAFTRQEKIVLGSFAVYFLVSLCFYIGHSFSKPNFSFFWELRHWELRHEVRMLGMIPLFYLLWRTGLKQWVLWYGVALAAMISAVYGWVDIYVLSKEMFFKAGLPDVPRAQGAYHPIAFGEMSLLLGFMSLAGIRYFHQKHYLLTVIPITALFGGMFAGFLSGTRMAFIAMPFLALVFLLQLGAFKRPWTYRILLILTLILLSGGYYHLPKSPLKYRITSGMADAGAFLDGKGTGRYAVHLGMWAEGWRLFLKHPLAGSGSRGYKNMIQQKLQAGEISAELGRFSTPHNMYLSNMISFGILGLMILLGIFLVPLTILLPAAAARGPGQDTAYAGIMLIVGFMLFGLTECIFLRNININFYLILLAAILTRVRECEPLQKSMG